MSTAEDWIKQVPTLRTLTGDDQWSVFLSYRSPDQAWVINLYDVLRCYGHKVLLDQVALTEGDQLQESQERAIAASQAGVIVCSTKDFNSKCVVSRYQAMEATASLRTDFKFVPVCVDASEPSGFASARTFLDFSSYPGGPNGGELLRLLHAVVGQPLSDEAARIALDFDEFSGSAANQIDMAIRDGSTERLNSLFAERGGHWRVAAALGCRAAEGLTQLGAYDDAVAMLLEIEREFPRAIRPKQLHALALLRRARGGGSQNDLIDAQQILAELYESGEKDAETLGIYASTWMERYERSSEVGDLERSRDLYSEAFAIARDDYYTGINAAAKSVFLEEVECAAQLALEVQKIVGTGPRPGDYWMTATVAEAWLIQRNYVEAARNYEAAVAIARSQTGSHKSTWKQACRLMARLGPNAVERGLIRKVFENLPDCDQL
ncbi:toll/interleukin-1 receptor domain-containing protein [Pseudomonas nabeulensis]|uniref:Toll/interleukin-1 receptor domain-containing protein n=1 Tax=Pseudomonas nabeulensis TaxID=2293833 RepID=A0A4Z0B415_9PSED|nr:toll/interleukin-1 receptor domain-containing protein [Pseudomonas nabeulensis]TFY93755.1 toll/interleukin-1 receptor domain-containing protein [Pseudomonas nabeulensis]